MSMDRAKATLRRLPPSTNAVTCRWFVTISLLCIASAVLSVLELPATGAIFTLVISMSLFCLVLGMRDFGRNAYRCEVEQ